MTAAVLADLERSRDLTRPWFRAEPTQLARSYGPGKWTMHQLLVHLVDSETVLFDRLRRLAADDRPLLWAYDENHWAERLDYVHRDLAIAEALYAATRASVIELATMIPADRQQRGGVHSESGRKTFAEVLAIIPWHNLHHLEQIRACAAAAGGTAPS